MGNGKSGNASSVWCIPPPKQYAGLTSVGREGDSRGVGAEGADLEATPWCRRLPEHIISALVLKASAIRPRYGGTPPNGAGAHQSACNAPMLFLSIVCLRFTTLIAPLYACMGCAYRMSFPRGFTHQMKTLRSLRPIEAFLFAILAFSCGLLNCGITESRRMGLQTWQRGSSLVSVE